MLRDLLLSLAQTDLFRARWTDQINEEWTRALLARNPNKAARVARTLTLVNQSVEDCLISGYESLIPTIELPDPNDRHVLAAAIVGEAHLIITFNLSDFPPERLEPFELEARHPDTFVQRLIESEPEVSCAAIRRMRTRYKNPPMTAAEFLDSLPRKGLERTADSLRNFVDQI